jgi:transcriptional regulator with XRE-family HTH domain
MDDVRAGSVLRAVRIRRGLTQAQVASLVGVSRSLVSIIERGVMDATSLRAIRKVGAALGVSLGLDPRWRGTELAKLLDERHAALIQVVTVRLKAAGWEAIPEKTFNEWGESGSIDVFAWQAATRALLAVEVKTSLPDLQDLLSTMDRKRRLAPRLARDSGWRPMIDGSVLALAGETWARNAVNRYGPIFTAAFPARAAEVRQWLQKPERDIRGIWFLSNDSPGSTKRRFGGSKRVRPRRNAPPGGTPRSSTADLGPKNAEDTARGAGQRP